jgi:DNA-binding transcriptional MerR regulator
MISFRRKKKNIDTLAEIKAKLEKPMEFETKLGETLERGIETIKTGVDKTALEDLSKRIEEENIKISRKFNTITKNVKNITLDNPEIVELIKLYSNASDKLEEFIEEMRRIEDRGWDFDKNVAAFFKFRIGKDLAEMKKLTINVENICIRAGFTPSNIRNILESPIENLVDSLSKKKIKVKKTR